MFERLIGSRKPFHSSTSEETYPNDLNKEAAQNSDPQIPHFPPILAYRKIVSQILGTKRQKSDLPH